MSKKYFFSELSDKVGQTIDLYGWVHKKRVHGKVTFIDLRDHTGLLQVVGGEDLANTNPEDVVQITGLIKQRQERYINNKIPTGSIEVEALKVIVINRAKTPPFPLDT